MSNFIKQNLQKEEKVQIIGNLSLSLIIPYISIILILISIWITIFVTHSPIFGHSTLNIIFIILSLFLTMRSVLEIISIIIENSFAELCFTNKRVIGKRGFLTTVVLDAPLNKINDIYIKQPFFGKIFKYSSIIINTSSNYYKFKYLKNAQDFKNALSTYEPQQNKDIKIDDVYEKLEKLKKLLDNKIITQEEFEIEKKKLLNKK